jgi:hypothetical protein
MLFDWFSKKTSQKQQPMNLSSGKRVSQKSLSLFSYSWIITGKLAIGPMPKCSEDWILLEKNGIKKRFSCCYPQEHIFTPIPSDWKSNEVSLPDHRHQEELTHESLLFALQEAISLLAEDNTPVFLHCFAGQERSTLLATGIVSITEGKDLFEALSYIRQCYPRARPLYEHLDILEKALRIYNPS